MFAVVAAALLAGQTADNSALSVEKAYTSLENVYNSRIPSDNVGVRQIGYDLLHAWNPTVTSQVDDDYLLGTGDQLRVYLWGDPVDFGAVPSIYDVAVDTEGSIFLKPIGRISVYGRTIGQIEGILKEKFSVKFKDLKLEVTTLQLRNFSVYVSGFSRNPGTVTVSNLWSAADILGASGGVLSEGSLRSIEVVGNGEKEEIDLYDLLISGSEDPVKIKVREGDIVHVPPIGNTAAIVGDVKRSGIYEMKSGETIGDLINFAGGSGLAGSVPNVKLLRRGTGISTIFDRSMSDERFLAAEVLDGDILILQTGTAPVNNMVQVSGPVANPGLYTIDSAPTLKSLVTQVLLLPTTSMETAILTRNEVNAGEEVVVFSPFQVAAGEFNLDLKPNDRIEFFTRQDRYLQQPVLVTTVSGESQYLSFIDGMTLLDLLQQSAIKGNPIDYTAQILRNGTVADQVVLRDILVRGKTDLDRLLQPGDTVVLETITSSVVSSGVKLLGQVASPGVYPLTEGMSLFDLLFTAGGYTKKAFPEGIVIRRESVQENQLAQYRVTIAKTRSELDAIENALSYQQLSDEAEAAITNQIKTQRALLDEAEKELGANLGRIMVSMPSSLERLEGSDTNLTLEEGDTVYIPEKPKTISVFGDSGSVAAIPWELGKSVRDYLFSLGGLRPKDYDISIIKYNGRIVTEDNLFFGWSQIENQVLDQGDAVIAVKRLNLPASTAFTETLGNVTDTVYKVIYSLTAVGVL